MCFSKPSVFGLVDKFVEQLPLHLIWVFEKKLNLMYSLFEKP
jgi:hypothetical protein